MKLFIAIVSGIFGAALVCGIILALSYAINYVVNHVANPAPWIVGFLLFAILTFTIGAAVYDIINTDE